jgi:cobalamin biosynthesis Mg chelatase CobN
VLVYCNYYHYCVCDLTYTKQRASLEQFGATADMLMGSVLDSSSAATTAAATSESEQQQQRATAALAEAHSMRNGTTATSSSAAPSHGGPTAAATAATATAVEESTDRWSLKNVNRVQFKPAGTLQLLWQTHSDLDIFAAKDLQEFALASDALQLADSSSRCVYHKFCIILIYICMFTYWLCLIQSSALHALRESGCVQ